MADTVDPKTSGNDNVPPERVATPQSTLTTADPTADYRRIATIKDGQALSAVNSSAAPSIEDKTLPPLTEFQETGYSRGKSFPVTLVKIGWERVEKFTGYDFLLMQQAAKKDGVKLMIMNGFRDMETQTRLYNERKNEPIRSQKGPAAAPGWSNHQSGKAVDLNTNMTLADKQAKKLSAQYEWLVANAAKFGFDNLDVPKAPLDEPWHWVHREDKLIAAASIEDALATLVGAESAAPFAVADGRPAIAIQASRDLYDRTKAYERSYQAARTSRDVHFANQAKRAILSSAQISNMAAQMGEVITQAVAKLPEPFKEEPEKGLAYDFTTGLWSDKEPV